MKILLAGPYPSGTEDRFRKLLPLDLIVNATTQEEYDAITDCDIIVVRVLKTDANTIAGKPQLKAIIRWGVGYDSVDIKAAGQRGVKVANTPGVNTYAVAELAVWLMISVCRRLDASARKCRSGIWDRNTYADVASTLNHKTIGLIGAGHIGRAVAKIVRELGAKVIYYDVSQLAQDIEADYNMTFVSFDKLLETSDIVSLHLPLLDNTRHIIGEPELGKMKKNAVIINTSRGELVDNTALVNALTSHLIGGAGLDCLEDEKLSLKQLKDFENVVITPHIGGTSNDLADEMITVISDMIKVLSQSGRLEHIVNQDYLVQTKEEVS